MLNYTQRLTIIYKYFLLVKWSFPTNLLWRLLNEINFLLLKIQEDNRRCHSSNLEKVGQSQTIYKEKILPPGHQARILIHNILLIGGAEKLILGVENIPGKIPVIFLLFTFNSTLLHLSDERFPMGSINGYCPLWYWIPNIIGTNMVFHHMSCHPWQVSPLFFNDPFISVWL